MTPLQRQAKNGIHLPPQALHQTPTGQAPTPPPGQTHFLPFITGEDNNIALLLKPALPLIQLHRAIQLYRQHGHVFILHIRWHRDVYQSGYGTPGDLAYYFMGYGLGGTHHLYFRILFLSPLIITWPPTLAGKNK